MIVALGFVAALLIGGILGLLGGGGSILATPAFVYLLGVSTKSSIVSSLVVVAVSSLVGGLGGIRRGEVDLRRAALFIAGSIPGSFAGGLLGGGLDDTLQMGLLAGVILITAVAMIRRARRHDDAAAAAPSGSGDGSRARMIGGIAIGVGVGLLTGVVGAGGGFLIVPALTLFFGMTMSRAIGTSMIVIAINSMAGLIGYVTDREIMARIASESVGPLSLPLFLVLFTIVMTSGVMVASSMRHRIDGTTLRKLFAYFLIIVGIGIIVGIVV